MKTAVSIFLLIFLLACNKDEPKSELEIYTDKFFEEAAARNLTLDRSNLIVKFVDISEVSPGYAMGTTNPPLVRISNQIWANISAAKKEILVFHELGHAMLSRLHTDEKLPNCIDYKSLMIGVDQFAYFNDDDLYTQRRRYYVDELFDIETAYPSWGGTVPANKTNIDIDAADWKFYAADGSNHLGSIDESDRALKIISGEGQRGNAFWMLTVPGDNIPTGASVAITFDFKTIDVSAPGAIVSVFGQGAADFSAYRVMEGTTNGWQTYKLVVNCYPSSKPNLLIYLTLPGSASGIVLFNNVKVESYN